MDILRDANCFELSAYSLAVLPLHGVNRNDPLLAEFADIHIVYKFPVGDCLAQSALVKPPQFGSVAERHETIEGSIHLHTMFPQFIAA